MLTFVLQPLATSTNTLRCLPPDLRPWTQIDTVTRCQMPLEDMPLHWLLFNLLQPPLHHYNVLKHGISMFMGCLGNIVPTTLPKPSAGGQTTPLTCDGQNVRTK